MKAELTITNAGKAALAAADTVGPDAITITSVAAGYGPRIIADPAGVTALQSEITRTAFCGNVGASPGSIAGYGLFEGVDRWSALEIGIYARVGDADEILFAYVQSVNNASGVRVPLLKKRSDSPVSPYLHTPTRYDFAFVFSPAPVAAPAPTPYYAPTPCSMPLTLSCFAPPVMPYYAPTPPTPPTARDVWRSINTRPPHADDVAYPVGHLWMHGKNEWVLESVIGGVAQWRQTKGIDLIYSVTSRPSGQDRTQYSFTLDRDMNVYSFLSFHTKHTDSRLSRQHYDSPIQISVLEFSSGGVINITDNSGYTTNIQQVNNTTIGVQNEDVWYYISKIYGIY